MITKAHKELIYQEAAIVRSAFLAKYGYIDGYCVEASRYLARKLNLLDIKVKLIYGVFKVDFDQCRNPTKEPSHDEAHTWCEFNGLPIDVTADQFNRQLLYDYGVDPIIIGTNLDRFLAWDFTPLYI